MDVTSTTATTTTAATVATASSGATISSDFETFLNMLTVQLENQDPLNPVSSEDYAMQLATFAGVEQQVQTNDLLGAMSAQMATTGLSQLASWVGQDVRVAAPAYFDGSAVTVAPNPPTVADKVEMVVRNAEGTEVDRVEIPVSAETLSWDGTLADGTVLPNGTYSFEIVSFSGDEVLSTDQAEIYATVTEIRSQDSELILLLEGGSAVAATAVSGLRNAGAV